MFDLIRKLCKLVYVMIFRDLVCAILFFTFQIKLKWIQWRNQVMITMFEENVRKHPERTAFIFNEKKYSFRNISEQSLKISNWIETGLQLGLDEEWERNNMTTNVSEEPSPIINNHEAKILKKIENNNSSIQIGLMFSNCPELACFIIGIARVRCSSVLFNTNHRRDTLVNAFKATNCKVFIFEAKYLSVIQDIAQELPDIQYFMYDSMESNNVIIQPYYNGLSRQDLQIKSFKNANKFAAILNAYPITGVQKKYPYKITDMIHYLFTSGTTGGNIKSVPVDNVRYVGINISQRLVFGLKCSDHIYVCLPCYHGFAGVFGLGSAFITGNTVTLAEKFSTSKFWLDCRQNGCTVALYIGEICRYLLAQPSSLEDGKHSLRMLLGIGLNKEVWGAFQKRFKIPKIAEFYSSTEGNILIANHQNVEGSCGFIPYYYGPLLHTLWPCHLIKVDPDTLELARSKKTGLCKFAKAGDVGMMVGEIRSGQIFTEYLGYTSAKESSKKLVRNVRRPGDFVFISGDLMEIDFYGNLYFKDRTGDTFRWKGENVSTTEVENIASQYLNLQDCIVYGVEVPKCEGRAGMLATSDQNANLDGLYDFLKDRMPEYAIPKFVRITDKIATTSTHKFIKFPFREDGINIDRIKSDKIYYFNRDQCKYLQMDRHIYDQIQCGNIQF